MTLLDDVTVVALEQAVAAPLASRHLADWGARVIKIERPGGGDFARAYDHSVRGLSSHFVWLNRGKESLTLDVKTEQGKNILHRLLESADVFIQNLAPGAAERLGLGGADLRACCPRLIVCNVSGYGNDGPYRNKKAYDLLVQAEAGLLSVTGSEDAPAKAGISVADIAAGMYAFSGILAALLRRCKSGVGAIVDVSLFDALAEWMSYPAYFTAFGGRAPARTGAAHATIYPYGPLTAADGRTVLIGIQNEREWAQFCRHVLQRNELVADIRFAGNHERSENRDALARIMRDALTGVDSDQLVQRLEQAGIAYGRMNTMREFWDHPQLSARGRCAEVGSPAGPLQMLRPPIDMDGERARMDAIPDVGEHTDAILRSIGYGNEDIAALRAQEIV